MKRNVLIITATLDPGGVERMVVDTAKTLAKSERYRPMVCSLMGNGTMGQELEDGGIEYYRLGLGNIKNVFGNISAVRRLIKECEPDIVHTHQLASDFYGSMGVFGLGIPVISHVHNPDMPEPLSRKIVRFFINRWLVGAFIATIEEKAEHLKRVAESTGKKLFVLHNAVDPQRLLLPKEFDKEEYRRRLSVPPRAFVLGSVGRMSWEKGYDLLLESFKRILEKTPNSFLMLIGDGPKTTELKERARRLEISNKVMFAGHQKDVPVWISLMDLFVVSSRMESFSLVTLEAMYLGVPTIITDTLSSRDVFSRAAAVVPCSVRGLQQGIEDMIRNPKSREQMSARGKKMVNDEFTIDTYITKLERIYDAILAKKS